MKILNLKRVRRTGRRVEPISLVERLEDRKLLSGTPANVAFSDAFTPAPSALWKNNSGNWTATDGDYYAQTPSGGPSTPAITELPYHFSNSNLTLKVTVNNFGDGGLVFDSNGTIGSGLVLVLGGYGYGQGTRGGTAGTSAYWVDLAAGSNPPSLAEANNVFTPGDAYTIEVTIVGDVYSLYVNGSTVPALTLTSSEYSSGTVGLYDDQPNTANGGYGAPESFSDFSVEGAGLPANITPSIKGKLPASVIAGQKTPISQTLTLTNTTGAVYDASATTQWFLDTGSNLDASAVALTAATTKTYKLKDNAHTSVGLKLASIPASVPAGTYYLIAEVTDAGGSSIAASATTISVAAPVISLSASLAPIAKIQSGATLTISNGGNIVDPGKFTQTVGFSTDAAGLVSAGLAVTTIKPLRLNPKKSAKLHISITKAQLAALTAGDEYYLTVKETDAAGNTVFAVSGIPVIAP